MRVDLRIGMAAFLAAGALSLPPVLQAFVLAWAWLLPWTWPSVFAPVTPQRQIAWLRFQPYAVLFVGLSVLIQGLFGEPPSVAVPYLPLSASGMLSGLELSLRAVLFFSAILVAVIATPPLELSHWLSALRLPVGIPVALLLSLQLLEDLPDSIHQIRRAQMARGLRLTGSARVRWRALRRLTTPVVLKSLEEALERATALQLRGLMDPVASPTRRIRAGTAGMLFTTATILLLSARMLQWLGLWPSIG